MLRSTVPAETAINRVSNLLSGYKSGRENHPPEFPPQATDYALFLLLSKSEINFIKN